MINSSSTKQIDFISQFLGWKNQFLGLKELMAPQCEALPKSCRSHTTIKNQNQKIQLLPLFSLLRAQLLLRRQRFFTVMTQCLQTLILTTLLRYESTQVYLFYLYMSILTATASTHVTYAIATATATATETSYIYTTR